jgi:hypothetical protein
MLSIYITHKCVKNFYSLPFFAFCFLLICFNKNIKAYSVNDTTEYKGAIQAVQHQTLLDLLAEAEKAKDKAEYSKTFLTFQNKDKLETIAYALQEGLYPNAIVRMIRDDKQLHDKRLVTYMPNFLKNNKDNGPILYSAVGLIKDYFPDPNLVPAVLDYAGESDYFSIRAYASPSGAGEQIVYSVFKNVADFLNKVTKGKLPGEYISDKEILGPPGPRKQGQISPRESYIQKWKSEWPKVQKELLDEQRELQMQIRPVAHQEILNILVERQNLCQEQKQHVIESEKSLNEKTKSFEELNKENQILNKKTEEILTKIRKEKKNDKLETIAYALTEGLYPDAVMSFVLFDKDLQDKRLVPYIAEAIKISTGEKLYSAVCEAYKIPDESLLPSLLGHALDNDYVVRYAPWGKDVPEVSVFLKTSQALYEITNGRIGHNLIEISVEDLYKQKDSLIKQWREIYEKSLKQ